MSKHSTGDRKLLRQNLYNAKRLYADLPRQQLSVLRDLTATLHLSIIKSEILYLGGKWYVSHSGLLRIAHRRRCAGIDTTIEQDTTQASVGRWVFKATVHKSPSTRFVGYGDADPSNVSPWSTGLRCGWPKPGLSTALYARPCSTQGLTASESARSRNSDPLQSRQILPASRTSSRRNLPTGTAAAPKSATAFAKSFASISSIPT